MSGRVRAFLACSLDGFVAGPDHDLSWLPGPDPDAPEDDAGYGAFMAEVGAMLMGRTTHDVVAGFDVDWPYGDTPVLVATHRPLTPGAPTVRAVSGDIGALVAEARAAAGGADVYVDGGALVRQALSAGLLDQLILTVIPIALGDGVSLFAGLDAPQRFACHGARPLHGGMVQLTYTPASP